MASPNCSTSLEAPPRNEAAPSLRPWLLLGTLILGYIGIYLCRKNFSVANPLIREAYGLSKEQIGMVASYSTLAYMAGKFAFGPIIDRIGGRQAFLAAMAAVVLFGALGGVASSLPMLTLMYSFNRLAGSAGWGGMVKLAPEWFPSKLLPIALGVLSLSFVFGGVCGVVLAGAIAEWSGNNWRWVMGGPSIFLLATLLVCWVILPRTPSQPSPLSPAKPNGTEFQFRRVGELLAIRRFWIVCGLSFALTLLRETFNNWTVDFFQTTGGETMSSQIAAFLSTPFDAVGAAGILLLGWIFGRTGPIARMIIVCSILSGLAVLLFALPFLASQNAWLGMAAVGGVGFLVYGPYSLLAGFLSVEIRGKEYAATVAGIVDGVGYLGAILAGQQFGRLLDIGGYALGFNCLAVLAAASALLSLCLYSWKKDRSE